MKKKIIILSGGVDSTTLLYEMAEEYGTNNLIALTFLYGSNHSSHEVDAAKFHTERLGIKHKIIDLREIFKDFKSFFKNFA